MYLAIMLIAVFSSPSDEDAQLRDLYHAAAVDKNEIDKFTDTCEQLTKASSCTSYGYCNMLHFLRAKNSFNPYRKWSEFNVGKRNLDSLIVENPDDIELRYMRHSIQQRVPGFLGYQENLEEDQLYMQSTIRLVSDSSVYQLIYNYLQSAEE